MVQGFSQAPDFIYQYFINRVLTFMREDFLPKVWIALNIPMQEEWQNFITEKLKDFDPKNIKNTIKLVNEEFEKAFYVKKLLSIFLVYMKRSGWDLQVKNEKQTV